MKYVSTRDKSVIVDSAVAIANGISAEGGLFVPESFPKLTDDDFSTLSNLSYVERAKYILKYFLTDFTEEEIDNCVKSAYIGSFDNDIPAPIKKIKNGYNILELWHGPTCAFKDLALQLLPYLLTTSAKKVSGDKKIVILVATSGDTGKAALEGFKDVPNTEIIVFYPSDGVSEIQKLQMSSQKGENVHVCAIYGNFDDAQSGVKKIFTDDIVKRLLDDNGMQFSSANSINWGRLVPQIIYYISAYCDFLNGDEDLSNGFNIVVPTGNFGNILAAYYAKSMGVPVNKLICASNSNNVLTDFINIGVYDRNRKFFTTISPSMDILISSNLERMIFALCDNDDSYVASLQASLSNDGKYEVDAEMKEKIRNIFYGGFCSDDETLSTISDMFKKYNYLCDTHTAVAINVYEKYVSETNDTRPVLIASTASPYKFAKSVLNAVADDTISADEFENIGELSEITNTQVPSPIAALSNAKVRFSDKCEKGKMYDAICKCLNI